MSEAQTKTARDTDTWIRLPRLPDHLHVIFCRILDIDTLPTDRLAASMQAVHDVCERISADNSHGVYSVLSSVYGRFLCVRDTVSALQVAERVLFESAAQGVRLAVGVAAGRLERLEDLARGNLVGHAINRAARLAAMPTAEKHVAIEEDVVMQACNAGSGFSLRRFGALQEAQVKATKLAYHILKHKKPSVGKLPGVPQYRAFDAHTVVCDIAKFSQQSADGQWQVVTSLRREVLQTLDPIAGNRAEKSQLWHAPAGDGYVLVFATDDSGGDLAWTFATNLAEACRDRVEIRLGIATGAVVIIGNDLPVGRGILAADQASSYPETGWLCVNRLFWQGRRDNVRNAWEASSVEDNPEMLLVHPPRPHQRGTGLQSVGPTLASQPVPSSPVAGGGLTLQDLIQQGLLDVLAALFSTPAQQQLLLAAIGFPQGQAPYGAMIPRDFWLQVCTTIANGGVSGVSLRDLLAAASQQYPGNATLRPYAKP